jgi:hypothetical protein
MALRFREEKNQRVRADTAWQAAPTRGKRVASLAEPVTDASTAEVPDDQVVMG